MGEKNARPDEPTPTERMIELSGEITDASANTTIAQLLYHQMQNPKLPVVLESREYLPQTMF